LRKFAAQAFYQIPGRGFYIIQQYESGRGDYTRDRRSWLREKSARELGEAIRKQEGTVNEGRNE
jgi:hypothetical protein